MYLGDLAVGAVLDFKFHTMVDGVMTTLAGSPVVSVYKGNGLTETVTGVTLTVDFDGRTGLHHVRIDTTADATFYATGEDFDVLLSAGTLGGNSVAGLTLAHFSLEHRASAPSAIHDVVKSMVIETEESITLQQAISVILAAITGRTTGGGLTFLTPNNGAVRIVATVDASHNRTGITLTPSA